METEQGVQHKLRASTQLGTLQLASMETETHLAAETLLQVQTALHDLLIIGTVEAARQGELLCGLHSNKEPSHMEEVAAELMTGHFRTLNMIDACSIARPQIELLSQTPEKVRGGFTE